MTAESEISIPSHRSGGFYGKGSTSSRNFSLFFFPNPPPPPNSAGTHGISLYNSFLKGTVECYEQLFSKIVKRYLWRLTFSRS